MTQNEDRPSRETRIVELKVRGMTDAATSAQLRSEGYIHASQKTVSRLYQHLKKDHGEVLIEELQRQQLADITLIDSRELKLKYRDRLLDKLMPRAPTPIQLAGDSRLTVMFDGGLEDDGASPDKA